VLAEVRREFKAQQRRQAPPLPPSTIKHLISDGRAKLKGLREMIGMRL
jgi:hypothetical protein